VLTAIVPWKAQCLPYKGTIVRSWSEMHTIPFLSWDERGVGSEVQYFVSPPLDLLSMLFVGSRLESAEQKIPKVEIGVSN
jgi:hypothetical protein